MYVRLLKTSFLVFIERTIMKTLFASVIGMLAIIVLREVQPWLMDSEEEIYKKFVENFLLEEGAPQFILTDRGTEFKNEILRNLMEMLKIRLRFTRRITISTNFVVSVSRWEAAISSEVLCWHSPRRGSPPRSCSSSSRCVPLAPSRPWHARRARFPSTRA